MFLKCTCNKQEEIKLITLKNGDGIKWPHGKRIAVLLTFDFDAEYLRYSVTGQSALGFSDISRGQYGPHEGLKRCLDMLARQNIKTTFFVPGIVAEKYADEVKQIAAAGHELAYHGYAHDARPGIPEAELPYVKQKFYKGSSKARGSGIGLSLVDSIMTALDGTLDLKSTLGRGTVVTLGLPIYKR